jgi:hypothetical protein
MQVFPSDQEYLYIKCNKCDDRVRLAANKGAGNWDERYFNLSRFLLIHAACDIGHIDLVWEG